MIAGDSGLGRNLDQNHFIGWVRFIGNWIRWARPDYPFSR